VVVRQELNEVLLSIRYPQPGMKYTLRWRVVDEGNIDSDYNLYLKHRAAEFAKRLLDARDEAAQAFYKLLCGDLAQIFGAACDFVLLAAEIDGCQLKVVNGPIDYIGNRIRIGRGVAGTAFKLRKIESYLKSGGFPYMEPNFLPVDPEGILSLPLLYPRIVAGKPTSGDGREFPFGVLSVIARNSDTDLRQFIATNRFGNSPTAFGVFHNRIARHFSSCFGKQLIEQSPWNDLSK